MPDLHHYLFLSNDAHIDREYEVKMTSEKIYFAYGSNMLTQRLHERTPSAVLINKGLLRGYTLKWTKKSFRDGSGKCHIMKTNSQFSAVWGVLYALKIKEKLNLDNIEGKGYYPKTIRIQAGNQFINAYTYFASAIQDDLKPLAWYKELVVQGAIQHKLPTQYIVQLQKVTTGSNKIGI